ncbi:hypothetical protein PAECIP111893_02375 [Paenibacillus plantiphilus]|uniref:Copper amine oxidase-like N-terminal domain-containing protein n=1 Tax=Paenibacillus plantiphilus TaxID=2905650 RepID=A0ABN8GGZ1_9BACL|nr:trypsin-like peptidase domain-containing protein [Paenibacillus plantiphilus]CAH1205589.1 hypothetical protein PAECIP111893_02375 [Paenibacillus plantiphilus]
MKKKLLIGLIAFTMISGTAYAATAINGLYKGRAIVKVTVNGTEVKSIVPGQLIDGATMLPLRAIAESLGATVDWDGAKQSASITTQQQPTQTGLTLTQLNKLGESVGIVYQLDAQNKQIGTGSAFVVDGIAVTNWHVADGNAVSLMIDFGSSVQTVQVKDAVFKNEAADLIGFKVSGVTGLKLNTAELKKGDKVYAIGFPKGRFAITEGAYQFNSLVGTMVFDAGIGPGSSGGALVNSAGQVIGVVVGENDGSPNGHAIPTKKLQDELNK